MSSRQNNMLSKAKPLCPKSEERGGGRVARGALSRP